MTLTRPATLQSLWAHQAAELERQRDADRIALFWEMRLGKSLLTIRWLLHRHRELGIRPNILLVAPLTPVMDWCDVLDRERQGWALARGSVKRRDELLNGPTPWKLVTYGSVIRTPALFSNEWTAIVLDESTCIKNPKAQVTRRMLRCLMRAPLKAILTGIPAPQRMTDIWTQMAWLYDGTWMGCSNFWRWRDINTVRRGFEIVMPPKKMAVVKAAAHAGASFLTRKQAGLANEKIRQRRCGELSPEGRKLYRQIVKTWEVPGVEAKHSLVIAGWLRRLTGGHYPGGEHSCWKYDELSRILQEDLVDEPVVVWFGWTAEIRRAASVLSAAGISFGVVDGSVELRTRKERVQDFRSGTIKVLLMQVVCGKYGLDLSVSDTAIYFSNGDSYENRAQSEDRIENLNKKRPLLYIDFVTLRTADEDTLESLRELKCDAAYLASKIKSNRRMG